MDKKLGGVIVFGIALTMAASGCAIKSPFAARSTASSRHPGDVKVTNAGNALGQQRPTPDQSFPQSVASAFKSAGASVSNALTIKPRVIPANDPTKLGKNPQQVGPEVYLSAARILEQRGDLKAAREQYERALEQDPAELKTLLGYARIHDRLEEFHVAENVYQRAIANHPTESITYNDLGLCLARQGKLEPAVNMLTRAARMEPEKKRYRNNLAIVLVQLGHVRDAYEHLAVVHQPAIAHYNLGVFLYRHEKNEEAIRHFAQAVEMQPDLTAAKKMLQMLGAQPPKNRQSAVVRDGSHDVPASVHFFVGDPEDKSVAQESDGENVIAKSPSFEPNSPEVQIIEPSADDPTSIPSHEDAQPLAPKVDQDEPGLLPIQADGKKDVGTETTQSLRKRTTQIVDEGVVTMCDYQVKITIEDNQFDTTSASTTDE